MYVVFSFKDFYEMFPERFQNKTNGITPRRWLLLCNPALSDVITEQVGEGWVTELTLLKGLKTKCEDVALMKEFNRCKQVTCQCNNIPCWIFFPSLHHFMCGFTQTMWGKLSIRVCVHVYVCTCVCLCVCVCCICVCMCECVRVCMLCEQFFISYHVNSFNLYFYI